MTNAELSILSLVAERPRHGYEIEQVIEERGMRDWTEIGFSSIYYLLKKLEKEGLVTAHLEEAARGPARRVYSTTEAGREALVDGLLDVLSVPRRRRSPLQLGLANLPAIQPAEAVDALGQYQDALAQKEEYLRVRRQEQQPLPYFVDAMFDLSLTLIEAEKAWIAGFAKQIERLTSEPGPWHGMLRPGGAS
jgi:DNA-binding PadR family transcriptional regulator